MIDRELDELKSQHARCKARINEIESKEEEIKRWPHDFFRYTKEGRAGRQVEDNEPVVELPEGRFDGPKQSKMTFLLPLYNQKRLISDKLKKIQENIKRLETKRLSIVKMDKAIQVRESILTSNKVSQDYRQQKHLLKLQSLENPNQFTTSDGRVIDVVKLKYAKRGFYLDLIENTSNKKMIYAPEEHKYDIDNVFNK